MSLNAQQIVTLSCQAAKCPGFIQQGGQFLNQVLDDLCKVRNLKINWKTAPLVVGPNNNGPFNLEPDYLRTYDLFFMQNNLPYFLKATALKDYDAEFKDPSIANYPYEWASDLSIEAQVASGGAGQLFIYPQSSGQITLTHRYFVDRADIVNPETSSTVPWFPEQRYLIKRTAAWLMILTDDARQSEFITECDNMLRPYLVMEGDEQEVVKQIALDPRRFRLQRYLKPTKVTG
jgi:hypothetical protein